MKAGLKPGKCRTCPWLTCVLQAVYYWLRVYLLSLREAAQKAAQELARLKAEAERKAAEGGGEGDAHGAWGRGNAA